MRIVDRQTFLALPAGTVFSKYTPIVFGELAIKGNTVAGVDFVVQDLSFPWFENVNDSSGWADAMFDLHENLGKSSASMDFHCDGRDGLFDEAQLFAIYEEGDVRGLIARLQEALDQSLKG